MSLEEFVSSERSYVKSLELIVNVFVDRIHTDATDAHVRLLFNNAAHIYTVNTSFLKDLEARLEDWKKDNSNGRHKAKPIHACREPHCCRLQLLKVSTMEIC